MTDRYGWQDRVGDVWAAEWHRTDRGFADLSAALDTAILAVAPQQGQAVDIGSGAGATSAALARARPGLSVLGIDLSPALVATACAERDALPNLRFVAGDAMTAANDAAPVDLFVSRHGVMFFDDPVAGFTALRRAAAPDAAIVFSSFAPRADNEWVGLLDGILGEQPLPVGYAAGPFAFADTRFVKTVLSQAGWTGAAPQRVPYRYLVGEGADNEAALADALSYFSRIGPAAQPLAAASAAEKAALLARLRDALAPYCRDGAVVLGASAWIWTARAGEAS